MFQKKGAIPEGSAPGLVGATRVPLLAEDSRGELVQVLQALPHELVPRYEARMAILAAKRSRKVFKREGGQLLGLLLEIVEADAFLLALKPPSLLLLPSPWVISPL